MRELLKANAALMLGEAKVQLQKLEREHVINAVEMDKLVREIFPLYPEAALPIIMKAQLKYPIKESRKKVINIEVVKSEKQLPMIPDQPLSNKSALNEFADIIADCLIGKKSKEQAAIEIEKSLDTLSVRDASYVSKQIEDLIKTEPRLNDILNSNSPEFVAPVTDETSVSSNKSIIKDIVESFSGLNDMISGENLPEMKGAIKSFVVSMAEIIMKKYISDENYMDMIKSILSSLYSEITVVEMESIEKAIKNPALVGRAIDTLIDDIFDGKNMVNSIESIVHDVELFLANPVDSINTNNTPIKKEETIIDVSPEELSTPAYPVIVAATDITEEQRANIDILMEKYFTNPDFYDQFDLLPEYKSKVKEATINQLLIALRLNDIKDDKKFILDYINYHAIGEQRDVTFYYSVNSDNNKDHVLDVQVQNLISEPIATYVKSEPAATSDLSAATNGETESTSGSDNQLNEDCLLGDDYPDANYLGVEDKSSKKKGTDKKNKTVA